MSSENLEQLLQVHQQLGKHESEIQNLKSRVEDLQRDVKEKLHTIEDKLDKLIEDKHSKKGAAKALGAIVTIGISLGTAFSWVFQKFFQVK